MSGTWSGSEGPTRIRDARTRPPLRLTVQSDGIGEPRVTDQDGRIVEDVVSVRWRQGEGGPAVMQVEICPAPADLVADARLRDVPPDREPALEADRVHKIGDDVEGDAT